MIILLTSTQPTSVPFYCWTVLFRFFSITPALTSEPRLLSLPERIGVREMKGRPDGSYGRQWGGRGQFNTDPASALVVSGHSRGIRTQYIPPRERLVGQLHPAGHSALTLQRLPLHFPRDGLYISWIVSTARAIKVCVHRDTCHVASNATSANSTSEARLGAGNYGSEGGPRHTPEATDSSQVLGLAG